MTEQAKKERAKTLYVVLSQQGGPSGWVEIATNVPAANASAAVRAVAGEDEGTYVAVPASSWNPVAVTVETQTVVKLGEPAVATGPGSVDQSRAAA